jgi:hypothetical protein
VHFTPTYGSRLSLVERWFAELTNKQLLLSVSLFLSFRPAIQNVSFPLKLSLSARTPKSKQGGVQDETGNRMFAFDGSVGTAVLFLFFRGG